MGLALPLIQFIILIAKAARQDEIKKQTQKHSTEGSVSDPSYFDMKACQFAIGAKADFRLSYIMFPDKSLKTFCQICDLWDVYLVFYKIFYNINFHIISI